MYSDNSWVIGLLNSDFEVVYEVSGQKLNSFQPSNVKNSTENLKKKGKGHP